MTSVLAPPLHGAFSGLQTLQLQTKIGEPEGECNLQPRHESSRHLALLNLQALQAATDCVRKGYSLP